MARGWESKSVAEQADLALARKHSLQQQGKRTDPAHLDLIRKKETLILSRTRVMREMELSQNPRYRRILDHALSDLNAQITEIGKAVS